MGLFYSSSFSYDSFGRPSGTKIPTRRYDMSLIFWHSVLPFELLISFCMTIFSLHPHSLWRFYRAFPSLFIYKYSFCVSFSSLPLRLCLSKLIPVSCTFTMGFVRQVPRLLSFFFFYVVIIQLLLFGSWECISEPCMFMDF